MQAFQPSRENGRSDKVIVLEYVRDAEPETIFTYEDLRTVLQEGTDRVITRQVIGSAVRRANKPLGAEHKRTLAAVAKVGYRIAKAEEHLSLAISRKRRAQVQMRTGYELMTNTRLDELTEIHRTMHIQQSMMIGACLMAIRSLSQRQNKQEAAIQHVIERVNRLENPGVIA